MYDKNSLSRIGSVPYAAGLSKSMFIYATADAKAAVLGANYFNADYKRFDKGDIIEVISSIGGTPAKFSIAITSAKGATTVTVAAAGQQALVDNTGGTTGQALSANAVKQTVVMPLQLADIAAGTFKIAMPFAFTVTSALFRTAKPASTAAKAATLTVGINGVAVTGGVMNLTTANQNAIGAAAAASPITAANTGTAGQTLEVTASAVTAFVEGDGWVEFTVVNNDLANALASLNAA